MKLKKGLLIVLEGIDGSGKTTQARLLARTLRRAGVEERSFREPTRGRWGRKIRKNARRPDSLTPEEELALFLKDRAEDVARNILPSLRRKIAVILDRYYFSTIAYQGAKGISRERIRRLNETFAPRADLIFILDVDPARGLGRIKGRPRKEPLFEREHYLARVRRIFRSFRGRRFIHLDGSKDKKELAEVIRRRVMRTVDRYRKTA
jgi:dTMP kinase